MNIKYVQIYQVNFKILKYMECCKTTYSISTQQIGVTTINVPTLEKKKLQE